MLQAWRGCQLLDPKFYILTSMIIPTSHSLWSLVLGKEKLPCLLMFCRITSLKRICNSIDCYFSLCHTKHCWITRFTNDHHSSLFMFWGVKSSTIVLAKFLHLPKHFSLIEGKLFFCSTPTYFISHMNMWSIKQKNHDTTINATLLSLMKLPFCLTLNCKECMSNQEFNILRRISKCAELMMEETWS